ncbi:MAG: hypothetical protein NC300_07725 [Bacteroidales bacterium]|nr:hypothetical protein [Clostridium sp.]MCM1204018.1 hypothetical protein [Bacteroidales bacterium]
MEQKREAYLALLRQKQRETGRYPKKSDFSEEETAMIKSFFGPWPRALEAAGIKEPRTEDKRARWKQKRIEQKRAANARRKALKKQEVPESESK